MLYRTCSGIRTPSEASVGQEFPVAWLGFGRTVWADSISTKGAPMLKPVLLFSALALTGAFAHPALAQEAAASPAPAPAFKIPAEAASQANPVKPSAESLAHSKKVYGYEC